MLIEKTKQNKNYFRKREIELNKTLENVFKACSMVGMLSSLNFCAD
jgi:hypothetical protein